MLVAYTLPGGGKIIDPGIAPRPGEVVDQKAGGPDKFIGDDLDQRLKAHGIKTVILCGTSAQGVGLGTGAGAAQRGYCRDLSGGLHAVGKRLPRGLCGLAYGGGRTAGDDQTRYRNPHQHDHLRDRQQIAGNHGMSLARQQRTGHM